ncbi:MAG TPA: hypothetical protein VFC92_14170 [Bacteroidales bacterium]|nr:hypothetical protein [Bacteroidales bacterium]
MRKVGIIMIFLGIIGVAVFGIQTFTNARSFKFFGILLGHHLAGYIPIVLSALLLIAGLLVAKYSKPPYQK